MMRIDADSTSELSTTSLSTADIPESRLHRWFYDDPSAFLDEELLVIGHEVPIETGDRIDVLAIDREANLVVVEIKRGKMHKGIHAQGLNYVSHVAEWSYEEIERCFDGWSTEGTLNQRLDEFCDDEEWSLNESQRLVILGNEVHNRTAKMATWLHREGVDLLVVTFDVFEDADRLYLNPSQLVPERSQLEIERGSATDAEWKRDGKAWHRRRTGEDAWTLLQELVAVFEEYEGFDRLSWTQQNYVAFFSGRKRLLKFNTGQSGSISLSLAPAESALDELDAATVATEAGVEESAVRFQHGSRWPLVIDCDPDVDVERLQTFVRTHIGE